MMSESSSDRSSVARKARPSPTNLPLIEPFSPGQGRHDKLGRVGGGSARSAG